MFENEKNAFVRLYSMLTLVSWAASIFFRRFRGFLGSINEAEDSALESYLVYLTSLCASVATKIMSSAESWQNTPERTSLSSSLPVAKIVFVIAFEA